MTSQPINPPAELRTEQGGAAPMWHVVAWIGRIVVAGLFLYAAALKIYEPEEFAKDIRSYQTFPWMISNVMAIIIPWIELSTAALLLAGVWRREARLLIIIMLVAFTALKTYALLAGIPLDCGCFGKSFLAEMSKGWVGVWLNVGMFGLLIAEGYASARIGKRPAAVETSSAA